ncbi:MAG: hypothetical protein JW395_4035 [Nitrospira sp.]|nr:hypothetical protein [Nitrospira sp.]
MVWTVVDGPVFMAAVSDRFVKVTMFLIVLSVVMFRGVQFYRRVTPAPNRHAPVQS